MEHPQPIKKSRSDSIRSWIGSPSFYIYIDYLLGAWGDRMWAFAVGLFLVKLSGGLLRLAAIYGFCGGGCVLLFGGLVGDWIDRNRRLKVMFTTLSLQNLSVMLSASAVCLTFLYADRIDSMLDGGMRLICEALIVILAIAAQISSMGYKIAIEKDWIIVISAGNKSLLANLNAVTRSIDLSCKILAPVTVGLIMTYASDEMAAFVIAAWNLFSLFVEFALLMKVYRLVPALAVKGKAAAKAYKDNKSDDEADEPVCLNPSGVDVKERHGDETDESLNTHTSTQPLRSNSQTSTKIKEKKTCLHIMFDPLIRLVLGWRTYAKQKVVFAGLSLSFLYMTVLGFDSITTGYIYANGVKEYLVAVSMGLAGFTGILGTIFFTISRKKRGLECTGIIAYGVEISFLSLCIVSLFTPGTTFDPLFKPSESSLSGSTCVRNHSALNDSLTHIVSKRHILNDESMRNMIEEKERIPADIHMTYLGVGAMHYGEMPNLYSPSNSNPRFGSQFLSERYSNNGANSFLNQEGLNNLEIATRYGHVIVKRQAINSTHEGTYVIVPNGNEEIIRTERENNENECEEEERDWLSYISISFFLIGIVCSRIGLWMADLTVTQTLQENVIESERGVVNGVQNSLNMLMDMLKFTLVIFVPHIPLFGYLIIASFSFIVCAGFLFNYHAWKTQGPLYCRSVKQDDSDDTKQSQDLSASDNVDDSSKADMV